MKNILINSIILMLFSVNLIAQTKEEKKQKKEDQKNVAFADTKSLIDSGTYIFNASFVNGGMSLATNTNRFIVKEGEVDIDLPFFGSARGDGGYNSNPRITYKGVPDKYDVEYIDKKRRSIIKIGIRSSNERHDITLTVGSSGQTTVKVISSSRSSINYSGYLKPLKE